MSIRFIRASCRTYLQDSMAVVSFGTTDVTDAAATAKVDCLLLFGSCRRCIWVDCCDVLCPLRVVVLRPTYAPNQTHHSFVVRSLPSVRSTYTLPTTQPTARPVLTREAATVAH